jgi:NADPH2:quinone reductase
MRAAWYERNGPAAEVLAVGTIDTPEPGPGEVRVRLHTSGVNPSDVKSRAGSTGRPMVAPRIIPHSDGGGVIDRVGADVPPGRIGERVWVWNGQWQRPFGTAAEYIVLPAVQAVRLPDNVDFAAAACLGIPALTAWQAVTMDGGIAGQTVLVQGGAGAVGHYAVQIAKLQGATVIATASAAKAAHARAAGADAVIDYKTEDVVALVRDLTRGRGVDRVIEVDLAANGAKVPELVRANGTVVAYGAVGAPVVPFGPAIIKNLTYRFFIVYNQPPDVREHALAGLTTLLAQGRLTHTIGARFPLERIAAAHEAVEQARVTGNVIIEL